jgi:hypothetical protein
MNAAMNISVQESPLLKTYPEKNNIDNQLDATIMVH